jgi:hypothetical protein
MVMGIKQVALQLLLPVRVSTGLLAYYAFRHNGGIEIRPDQKREERTPVQSALFLRLT